MTEAIAEYRAAARLDPTDSWTYGELARACLIGLELDAALDASHVYRCGSTLPTISCVANR